MPNVVRSTLPQNCAAACISLALCVLPGCAHRLGVKVIDSGSGTPIAGARVTRLKVCLPPFWVVGPVLPVEQCETDDHGLAHLRDCEGSIQVEAAGFNSAHRGLGDDVAEVVIPLERIAGEGPPPETPLVADGPQAQ